MTCTKMTCPGLELHGLARSATIWCLYVASWNLECDLWWWNTAIWSIAKTCFFVCSERARRRFWNETWNFQGGSLATVNPLCVRAWVCESTVSQATFHALGTKRLGRMQRLISVWGWLWHLQWGSGWFWRPQAKIRQKKRTMKFQCEENVRKKWGIFRMCGIEVRKRAFAEIPHIGKM